MFVICDKCKYGDFFEDKCPAKIKEVQVVKGIGIVECPKFTSSFQRPKASESTEPHSEAEAV